MKFSFSFSAFILSSTTSLEKMPVINVDDLTDKDKAVMEVNQLKVEVKLERWLVSGSSSDVKTSL